MNEKSAVKVLPEEISKFIDLTCKADHVYNLRTVGSVYGGYYNDFEELKQDAQALSGAKGVAGVYVTVNPCQPVLLARSPNGYIRSKTDGEAKAHEMLRRDTFLIDVDPKRVKGVMATDAEKEFARLKNIEIREFLASQGWPDPLIGDSGSGYNQRYRIELPNDHKEGTSYHLVSDCLHALDSMFTDQTVGLDLKVVDASRVSRIAGTLNAKGADFQGDEKTGEPPRPHRFAHILSEGSQEIVAVEQLQALAVQKTKSKTYRFGKPDTGKTSGFVIGGKFDGVYKAPYKTQMTEDVMEGGLDFYGLKHGESKEIAPPPGCTSRQKWDLEACVFNPEHGDKCASVMLTDGNPGYQCHHHSCQDNHWYEAISKLAEDHGKKYDGWFNPEFKAALSETAVPVSKMTLKRGTDVESKKIDWLWQNRIPTGMLVLLVGQPGVGKGLFTMDVAARATTGKDWFDSKNTNPPMEVLIISSEDSIEQTLKPRLQAAGADMSKILFHDVSTLADGTEKEFSLDTDLPALNQILEDNPDIKMIIIDPTSAHFGEINENRTQEVRQALSALKRIIEPRKVAVILVTHYNKVINADHHLDRIAAARGLPAACRVIWAFTHDGSGIRKMLLHKSNIMEDPNGLEFEIESKEVEIEGDPVEIGKVKWLGKSNSSIAEELKSDISDQKINKTQQAKAWLAEYMKSGEPIPAVQVEAAASAVGMKKTTLVSAYKKLMGKKPFKHGFGGGWYWQLNPVYLNAHIPTVVPDTETSAFEIGGVQ